ncbi:MULTISPECIES: LysR family transcriptional regulator [unclassified Sphingomonas]|jgi:DNA-binding transcriptional LysR family regulator|uniref:LysR family transcriptional regulator n=1 Tax=unclassified Sphingomonas TaxID=196159 RepID=UPI0025DB8398|nr:MULTISPECIES: LysR family transcriptional regulator [unclassified Sphingomonas]
MIDRYHLRYFLAVVDSGNFSRAATACNVSQPTLSVGIAKLEASLGKTLFNRTNRRVELTEAGSRLVSHARMIETGFATAEREVVGSVSLSTVRLGVLATTPRRWIEAFLAVQRAASGSDRIEIVEGKEQDLRSRLARGRIDVALTILRDGDAAGGGHHLLTEGYSLALGASHPLAARESVRIEELANDPMIVRRHCELLPETSRFFTAQGIRPFFPARTTSDDKALGYVRAGLGLTVMPDSFRDPGIARVRLDGFDFTRDIGLVYAAHVNRDVLPRSRTIAALARTLGPDHDG